MPNPGDPDVSTTTDASDTLPVDIVDTAPDGDEPQASLPPAVEAAVELSEIAPTLTVDASGLSNY
jgi:hypothetical protein